LRGVDEAVGRPSVVGAQDLFSGPEWVKDWAENGGLGRSSRFLFSYFLIPFPKFNLVLNFKIQNICIVKNSNMSSEVKF
jgi:hypothetical protein